MYVSTNRPNNITRTGGFSLVELLVVIAIICIVTAVGFTAMAHAHEDGRKVECANNERQLTLALMQYTQDNNDVYPSAAAGKHGVGAPNGWIFVESYNDIGDASRMDPTRGSLYPYVKQTQVYLCPDDNAGRVSGDSYAYNSCLTSRYVQATSGPGLLYTGKPVSHFTTPALTLAFGEEDSGVEIDGHSTNDGLMNFPNDFLSYATRHDGGSNVSLLDGHVKWYPYDKLFALDLQEGLGDTPCNP